MPRKYLRKTKTKYTIEQLDNALQSITDGASIYAVSKETNIPYETLRRNSAREVVRRGSGGVTVLSAHDEKLIVQSILVAAEAGFPMNRRDIRKLVKTYLDEQDRKTRWIENYPGIDWCLSFESRHGDVIAKKKPEVLALARAEGLTGAVVDGFFDLYEGLLNKLGLLGCWDRVFNLDETGLNSNPVKEKVYSRKGGKSPYFRTATCGKASNTVMFCCSATGEYLPPFIVYKGKHLYHSWTLNGPKGALYSVTESGWMHDYVFENWIRQFAKYVEDRAKPILLIIDGHGSHLTYGTAKICRENNIELLCLPAHTSHALQPLDVGVFKNLKVEWRKILTEWARETRLQKIDKSVFPSLLLKLCDRLQSGWAVSGFEGSGLAPVNRNKPKKRVVSTVDDIPVRDDLQHLQKAVQEVLAPEPSPETTKAQANARKKRRRIQANFGEVLTSEESIERLRKEDEERQAKKKRNKVKGKGGVRSSDSETESEKSDHGEEMGEICERDRDAMKGVQAVRMGDIKVNDWVLASCGEKKYLGQVEECNGGWFKVRFVRHKRTTLNIGGVFEEADYRDVDEVDYKEIFGRVDPPVPSRRGECMIFEVNGHLW